MNTCISRPPALFGSSSCFPSAGCRQRRFWVRSFKFNVRRAIAPAAFWTISWCRRVEPRPSPKTKPARDLRFQLQKAFLATPREQVGFPWVLFGIASKRGIEKLPPLALGFDIFNFPARSGAVDIDTLARASVSQSGREAAGLQSLCGGCGSK